MKKLSSYLLRYWYAYAFAVACMTISIFLDMLSPQITKRIIDDVILGGNADLLTKLLVGILIVGIGRSIFQYLKEYIFDYVSVKIGCEMRKHLFTHIQGLSVRFFDNTNTGELMARIKDDIDKIWAALGYVGMLILEVAIHTSVVIFCMLQLSPKLSLLPLLSMPIVAMIAFLMEHKLGSVYEDISEENAVLNTVAEENLAGVRTVKSFAREKFEISKFLSHNRKYYELNMKQSKVVIKYHPAIQLITKSLPIGVIIYGGYLVMNKEMTLGSLGAFVEYSMNIVWPMEMLGWLTNDISSALASSKKLRKIYEEKPDIVQVENPTILSNVAGNIVFNHVSFSQGDNHILNNINFHLEAGKTLGIMGATGSGKTSIINLLQRFYEASNGNILLDGVDIKELELKNLRSNIALVMQDSFLFSDTIDDNIKLGKKEQVDHNTLLSAVTNARARDFIERMDQQYETVVGERGVGLSGGQKQRISIARALAKNLPILILDDSTSALDTETEHMIQKALDHIHNTTKIVIAHRISAVRHADEIIVLNDGKIAERGDHESLLSMKGFYYKTYMAQYGELDNAAKDIVRMEVNPCQ